MPGWGIRCSREREVTRCAIKPVTPVGNSEGFARTQPRNRGRHKARPLETMKLSPSTAEPRPATERIAIFGGIYNNYLALEAALADAKQKGCSSLYCLGDLGAFGPHPDRVFPLLVENRVATMQGNYDH